VQTELLEDVQARTDVRSFRIDRAGVASLHHPMMTVLDRAHGVHHTVEPSRYPLAFRPRKGNAHEPLH
jgi:hypothetical protein